MKNRTASAMPLSILCLLLLSACGSGDAGSAPADSAAEPPAQAVQSGGTLSIGETTYELVIRGCNLEGENDGMGPNTLDATAIARDGGRHTLEVSRIGSSQSIMLAISMAENLGWEAEGSAGDGGLIEIDGTTVRSTATYKSFDGAEEVEGTLSATCP